MSKLLNVWAFAAMALLTAAAFAIPSRLGDGARYDHSATPIRGKAIINRYFNRRSLSALSFVIGLAPGIGTIFQAKATDYNSLSPYHMPVIELVPLNKSLPLQIIPIPYIDYTRAPLFGSLHMTETAT
jgi:hypothetical protein